MPNVFQIHSEPQNTAVHLVRDKAGERDKMKYLISQLRKEGNKDRSWNREEVNVSNKLFDLRYGFKLI